MRTETAVPARQPVLLKDYRPPAWIVDTVSLDFDLQPDATRVTAQLAIRRNPDGDGGPLRLDGRGLTLVSAHVDGAPVSPALDAEGLTLDAPLPDAFTWTAVTQIDPAANKALEGLYLSKGMYCTQCEAQGFRKITYFPDRPDVMARYEVRVEADAATCPVLLSNGDLIERGEAGPGRAFALWRDPHPKPSYLFALVAGDLRAREADYETSEGRACKLAVWVRPGDESRCDYALDALIRSMRWDERVYGRAYDLDLFNIVAVDDFNMGAMENKGLNIFNAKYVLASPETATDADYERIESIVAHEYFHNWTGNRITCRDWFQLCLKEGLTVYRDQQFTGDERSHAVKRIEDVMMLRARQFREDGGPLAHAVRPESYVEINNFYTATIYEKGAEIIGMLRALVGAEGYRRALDLYFERHDGQACTIEDFRRCFEDSAGRDLTQFARWWSQAGTPTVTVTEDWDADAGRLSLTLRQHTAPTPGQPDKGPLVIPVALGLLGADGADLLPEGTRVIELSEPEATVAFDGLTARPTPSLLRGFSAPVRLERATTDAERAFLLAHDSDPFNRWQAGRAYAADVTLAMVAGQAPASAFLDAMTALADDDGLDPAFRAMALATPGVDELARETHARGEPADPAAIHAAALALRRALAERAGAVLERLYADNATPGAYSPDAASAGKRALRNRAMGLLILRDAAADHARAAAQYFDADNMTEAAPALTALVHAQSPRADEALAHFHDRWKDDAVVIDKWLSVQATAPTPDVLSRVQALTGHPSFDWLNPNKFRALIGGFAMANPSAFHAADGSGYAFVADWLIRLDARNPQTTARLAGCFETWLLYDDARQGLIRAQLERIAATPGLSKDTADIVGRVIG